MDADTRTDDDIKAELQRLRDSLPKTADGVTVVPGMYVYYQCTARDGAPVQRSLVKNVSKEMWQEPGGGQPYFIRKGEPYFSTEQLAREHRARQLQEIADRAKEQCLA